MRDCDYALAWKVADRFPELFEFQNKLSLVIEWYIYYWIRLLLNVVISQCLADQLFPFAFTLLGDWPAGWPADRPNDQPKNLADRLRDWLAELTDGLTVRLGNWLTIVLALLVFCYMLFWLFYCCHLDERHWPTPN